MTVVNSLHDGNGQLSTRLKWSTLYTTTMVNSLHHEQYCGNGQLSTLYTMAVLNCPHHVQWSIIYTMTVVNSLHDDSGQLSTRWQCSTLYTITVVNSLLDDRGQISTRWSGQFSTQHYDSAELSTRMSK